MSGKLTKAQRAALAEIIDWSAAYEVAERLRAEPDIRMRRGVQIVLGRLVTLGFAEHSAANWTYRITPSGRAALASEQQS